MTFLEGIWTGNLIQNAIFDTFYERFFDCKRNWKIYSLLIVMFQLKLELTNMTKNF